MEIHPIQGEAKRGRLGHDGLVPLNFFARVRPRLPLAAADGHDEAYSPPAEGCDLLGTGVDHLRAYLKLHPTRLATLHELCAPVGDHLRAVQSDAAADSLRRFFPWAAQAAASGEPTLWEAILQDLLDSTAGGPGLTVTPVIAIISRAMSDILYGSEDNGLLFAASDARTTAIRLVHDVPSLMPAVTELVLLSRDAIGLRAARVGLHSILLHRRVPNVDSEDLFELQRTGPLSATQLARPELYDRVRSMIDFRTLSVWASDLSVARNWPAGADAGTQSALVMSIRVPVSSLWFAPRSNDREFFISPEAIRLDHVEVLHRV